ncbi:MAG: twin-arginine translocation signal domain-containing protein [Candidatus Hydrothermarchaeales archaeon]
MVTRRDFIKLATGTTAGLLTPVYAQTDRVVEFHVKLKRFEIEPEIIRVKKGDTVRLYIEAVDIEHGLYIDGYDIDVRVRHAEQKIVEFKADKTGAYRMRCSVMCGPLHPFMVGKFVVEPNNRFIGSIILSLLLPFALLAYLNDRKKRDERDD